ncbi:MAG: phosphopantothenoylcysteine decarboxylase [Turneriella sp.]|nr:phosphopantothenoylcysteine decarboxylase [Turneriella sp.]
MRHFVVTSGPTREFLDPIRYISNPSTGRMGHAIAMAAVRRHYQVTYIAGPGNPEYSNVAGAKNIAVTSTEDMLAAVLESLTPGCVLVMAAAPADYRPKMRSPIKIKKRESPQLQLVANPDILQEAARRNAQFSPRAILVGFAAETHDTERYALAKLREKDLDMIFLNDVSKPGMGFGAATNALTMFSKDGRRRELPLASKEELGEKILDCILEYAVAES